MKLGIMRKVIIHWEIILSKREKLKSMQLIGFISTILSSQAFLQEKDGSTLLAHRSIVGLSLETRSNKLIEKMSRL